MAAVPLETTLGLVIGILSAQFFPRQALREPCYLPFEYFVYAAVTLSIGLPCAHWILGRWSPGERLAGLAIAVATFALLFYGLDWRVGLRTSWEELW